MTEERREVHGVDRGCHEWFPLIDEDDQEIADYAGCGSHEIEMTPEHAAILEAAYEMHELVIGLVDNTEARRIIASIKARIKEFNA